MSLKLLFIVVIVVLSYLLYGQLQIKLLSLWTVIYGIVDVLLCFLFIFVILPISRMRPKEVPLKFKFQTVVFHTLLKLIPIQKMREGNVIPDPKPTDLVDVEIVQYEIAKDKKLQVNYFKTKGCEKEEVSKVIVFYHAGGFVIGEPNQLTPFILEFFKHYGETVVVAAVNYRKCPDVSLNKVFTDAKRMLDQVSEYVGGYKNKKLILAGESAGGRLAAHVSQILRDLEYNYFSLGDRENVLCTLFYPHLCHEEEFCDSLESHKKFKNGVIVSKWFEMFLKKHNHFENGKDIGVFEDLRNVPQTFLMVGEWDYLYSEGEKYIEMIQKENGKEAGTFICLEKELHMFLDKQFVVNQKNFGFVAKTLAEEIKKAFDSE